MAGNTVTISSDSSTLTIKASQIVGTDPDMQFEFGSFKGAVDERRVAFIGMVIPTSGKRFTMRFEFTDPALATVDIRGLPVYLTAEERVTPFSDNVRERQDKDIRGPS